MEVKLGLCEEPIGIEHESVPVAAITLTAKHCFVCDDDRDRLATPFRGNSWDSGLTYDEKGPHRGYEKQQKMEKVSPW